MGKLNSLVTALPPLAVCIYIILCPSYVKDPVLGFFGVNKGLVLFIKARLKFPVKGLAGGCHVHIRGACSPVPWRLPKATVFYAPPLTHGTGQGREALKAPQAKASLGIKDPLP